MSADVPVELEVQRLEDLGLSRDDRILRASGRAWAASPLLLTAPVLVAGSARVSAVTVSEMTAGPSGPAWSADFRVPETVAEAAERWAVETAPATPVARTPPATPAGHDERAILGGRRPGPAAGAGRARRPGPAGSRRVASAHPLLGPARPLVASASGTPAAPVRTLRLPVLGGALHALEEVPETITRLEQRVSELAELAGRTRAADARRATDAEAWAAAVGGRVQEAEDAATAAASAQAAAEAALREQADGHADWLAERDAQADAYAYALRRLDVALAERDEALARADALAEAATHPAGSAPAADERPPADEPRAAELPAETHRGILAGAGALLTAEAITTAIWQEPLSAVLGAREQSSLRQEERELAEPFGRDVPAVSPEGTTVLAGRTATFGAPFRRLDELRPGDELELQMPYGTFTYRVERSETMSREDAARVGTGGDEPRLVLSAPDSRLRDDELLVVSARQVDATPRGPAA